MSCHSPQLQSKSCELLVMSRHRSPDCRPAYPFLLLKQNHHNGVQGTHAETCSQVCNISDSHPVVIVWQLPNCNYNCTAELLSFKVYSKPLWMLALLIERPFFLLLSMLSICYRPYFQVHPIYRPILCCSQRYMTIQSYIHCYENSSS